MISAWLITSSTQHRAAQEIVVVQHKSSCFFLLSSKLIVLSRSLCSPPLANYTRTADHSVTSPTSAQHKATINSSAQAALGVINSLIAPNHGPFLSPPFTYVHVLVAFLRERSGRRQPPAERSPSIDLLLAAWRAQAALLR